MTNFMCTKVFCHVWWRYFFRQDVDFSSFFSLFSTPQKDPQNGLKMGLRADHCGSVKMIMTNILVRSQAPQRMFILIIFVRCVDIHEGCYTRKQMYEKVGPSISILASSRGPSLDYIGTGESYKTLCGLYHIIIKLA
jgi:hypothetical protein